MAAEVIIIIGAGVAGLSAASVLTRAGVSVHLIEARDRIGGRIHTVREAGLNTAIELGAEFVHGKPPEIRDLLNGRGLVEGSGRDWCSQKGQITTCDFFGPVETFLARMKITEADQSFRQFAEAAAEVPEEVKQRALRYVEGFNAARAEEISVNSLVRASKAEEEIDGDRVFRVAGGYDCVPRALLSGCDPRYLSLSLNTVVRAVEWSGDGVVVRALPLEKPHPVAPTPGATRVGQPQEVSIGARRAIITLPLGVLQSGVVEFVPALQEKQNALSRLVMGRVVRVTLHFRERFWERLRGSGGQSLGDMRFLFTDNEDFPTWWTAAPLDAPLITGWAPSQAAERLSGKPAEVIKTMAVNSLAQVLPVSAAEIPALLVGAHVHDWQSDPFSRGAYSYARAGGDGAQRELAEPITGTLFLAGEACDEGHFGTVHGAIASGRRAAGAVLGLAGQRAA